MARSEKRPLEAALYDLVERWLRRQLGCWEARQNTGPRIGRIDVVGIRDIGGDLSGRSEVVAVEVKAGRQPFATSAGQAHGYSVMADRCYLADFRTVSPPFSQSEMLVAGRLGIGLIAVGASRRINEVLTAPPQDPIEELRLQVIEKLGLSTCALCSTVFRRSDRKGGGSRVARQGERPGAMRRAVLNDKGFAWWLWSAADERDKKDRNSTYWRRYLCSDCTFALFRDFTQAENS